MNRIYNLKRQNKDGRDFSMKSIFDPHPDVKIKLPKQVDLRSKCPEIFDQGELGSCTANAGVTARMMLLSSPPILSRLDLYYSERLLNSTVSKDSGAQMRDIGKALSKYGVCEEKLFPYDISKFKSVPSQEAFRNAITYSISTYHSLSTTDEIKNFIALKQQPVLTGMDVYDSFESPSVSKSGIVHLPKKREQILGGHAVLIVGYDDAKKWFIMRNSWGASWGDKGYFYLPYTFFAKKFAYDFWVLQ